VQIYAFFDNEWCIVLKQSYCFGV